MTINIAANLKRLRKQKDLTQEELAKFLGVSFQAISKWERGDGYPDITFLPVIANYFDVTLDELMGMDNMRSRERLGEIHAQWKENNAAGKNAENIRAMREALQEYPGEWLLMVQLVTSMEKCEAEPEEKERNRAEAIDLSERIIEHCTDPEIRNAFLFNICHSYWKSGNTGKAVERARLLPSIYKTRENALVMFLEGEEKVMVGQQAVLALTSSLSQQILFITDTGHYTPEEKVILLKKFCEAADLLYEQKDVPTILRFKAAAFLKIADICIDSNNNDAAVEYLESAADAAIRSINFPLKSIPVSLLANSMEVETVTAGDFKKLQINRLLTDKKYDCLRSDDRFAAICNRIKKH